MRVILIDVYVNVNCMIAQHGLAHHGDDPWAQRKFQRLFLANHMPASIAGKKAAMPQEPESALASAGPGQ